MLDWFRFVLTAVLMLAGLFVLLVGVVSQYRFRYVLNRMHAASMGDSLGLLLVLTGLYLWWPRRQGKAGRGHGQAVCRG